MAHIPDVIKAFQKAGTLLLKQEALKNLFFSFGSYQGEIVEKSKREPLYSFIQIGKSGELKDFFCTCHESEGEGCPHVSALYLLVFGKDGVPLHERYQKSLYRALMQLFYEKRAIPATKDIIGDGGHLARLKLKTPKGKDLFEETFFAEPQEEAGLWGLSIEEEDHWKSPDLASELLFEQSPWNEWGKKLAFLDPMHGSKETVKTDSSGLPVSILLDFKDVQLDIRIERSDLPRLIPYLSGYSILQGIEGKSIYHEKSAILEIPYVVDLKRSHKKIIHLPGWVFIKDEGFIKEEAFFPSSKILLKAKIPGYLKNTPLEKRVLKYDLGFNSSWDLVIDAYLFVKGDLLQKGAWLYKGFAYLPGKGFFQVEDDYFHEPHLVIHESDVSSFVHEKRSWLSQMPGFDIHPVTIASEISYIVQADGSMLFTRKSLQTERTHEFGPWTYVWGSGFFPREGTKELFFIKPNTIVTREHIPLFIKERREELKLIRGFFRETCPIKDVELEVLAVSPDELLIKPVYRFNTDKEITFFEDIAYIPHEGFFELPPHLRLPEEYIEERKVPAKEFPEFFGAELPAISRFIPMLDVSLKKPTLLKLFISKLTQKDNHYKIKLFWSSEYGQVDFLTVWQGKIEGRRYFFTKAGLLDLKDDHFRWLNIVKKQNVDKRSGMLTISALEFYRLDALEGIECRFDDGKESLEIINQLRQFKVAEKIDLSLLTCSLRPYQQTGVEWLWFLYVHGLSGLLCDDMGLGKTHQAMAIIASALSLSKEKVLVIAPASVIHHWEDKIKAFLPKLKATIYHGTERSLEESDIIITTYGIMRKDIHLFEKITFRLAIFDEIQIAKNKESRVHTVLKKVKAVMKIGLSGTPIENTLFELKSLFDIVLPHYMPSDAEFKERFTRPIQKEQNEEAKLALRRLIRPFVLRRKKSEVLLELPEKTEEISHCDLSKEQVDLYNGVLAKSREPILRSLTDETSDIPYFHIFALLTELKKICDHPALFLRKMSEYEQYASGKWNLFLELLSEAFESGQKVVVFTQYLGMLDIMEDQMNKMGVGYALLKGSTKDRGGEVRRFNEDPACRVFLGSLLAGGLGIDLIAGSIVIHYDRWWNAARENQATDRVYRIGQKRGVQVFKLVTKNTFEERIDEIIREKGKLAEDIITSEEAALKLFDRADLRTLLEYSKWEPMEG